jgi:glycopeptide antibiotics resistance protein
VLQAHVVWPYAVLVAVIVMRRGVAVATPRLTLLARILLVLYLGWLAAPTGSVVAHVDLVPFSSVRELLGLGLHWQTVRILAGNILVFAPFGALLPIAVPRLATWKRILPAGLALSLSIELGQLAVSLALGYTYRLTEIDDVLLNVAGVLLGFGACHVLPVARVAPSASADCPAVVAPPRERC